MHLHCSPQKIQQLSSSFVLYPSHIAYIPMKAMLSCPELQGLFRASPFLLIHSCSSLHHKACLFSVLSSYKAVFLPCPLCRECPASSNELIYSSFFCIIHVSQNIEIMYQNESEDQQIGNAERDVSFAYINYMC